jgi:hypothetical protein
MDGIPIAIAAESVAARESFRSARRESLGIKVTIMLRLHPSEEGMCSYFRAIQNYLTPKTEASSV